MTTKMKNKSLLNITIEPIQERYYLDSTSFGIYVARVLSQDESCADHQFDSSICVTGEMPRLSLGRQYKLLCTEFNHPKYGHQYKVTSIYSEQSLDDETSFLATLVTPLQLSAITSVYSNPVTAIMSGEFDCSKVRGIGIPTYNSIKKKVEDNYHLATALASLGQYGITFNAIKKIVETYGNAELAVKSIQEDPYILYREVDGFGFTKADQIAMAFGIGEFDSRRINAGIMYVLDQNEQKGNTWGFNHEVRCSVEELLGYSLTDEDWIEYIQTHLHLWYSEDTSRIALSKTHNCELNIAEEVKRLQSVSIDPLFSDEFISNFIDMEENVLNIKYTDKQKELFYSVNKHPITVFTGFAGSGKSASLNTLLNILDTQHKQYILLSPTAKAAKVIERVTKRPASTIHRGLQFKPQGGFTYGKDNQLPHDIIIVDEFSMCDIYLARQLLYATRNGTRIVFVGDPAQLESVAVGNVLHDFISSDKIPVVMLDKVFRQALDSGIISAATSVREGKHFFDKDDSMLEIGVKKDVKCWFGDKEQTADRVLKIFSMCIQKYSIEDIMVLSPMKKGNSGVQYLNNQLQEIYNPADFNKSHIDLKRCVFRVGDKVRHTKNLYDQPWLDEDYEDTGKMGVFNGDTGVIIDIKPDNNLIYVNYGDKIVEYTRSIFDCLDLAYCITVHSSQGSQAPVVIMAIDTSHYCNLKRSLLYTGITRASERLFIVGSVLALSTAIKNNALKYKQTFLSEYIRSICN